MAGQVDGDERTVERQRDGVPGVGVLRAAVDQHELGRRLAPHQGADPSRRPDVDECPADQRRAVVGDAELGGVVGEVGELVVRHPADGPVIEPSTGDAK